MAKIFISHSSKDKSFARKLSNDLTAMGHKPWLDEWEITIGECIIIKVESGIKESDFIVIVLSNNSVNSGWVEKEWKSKYWEEINQGKIFLLPVLIEDCDRPFLLATKKYADFRSNYSIGFADLSSAISRDRVKAGSELTQYCLSNNNSNLDVSNKHNVLRGIKYDNASSHHKIDDIIDEVIRSTTGEVGLGCESYNSKNIKDLKITLSNEQDYLYGLNYLIRRLSHHNSYSESRNILYVILGLLQDKMPFMPTCLRMDEGKKSLNANYLRLLGVSDRFNLNKLIDWLDSAMYEANL